MGPLLGSLGGPALEADGEAAEEEEGVDDPDHDQARQQGRVRFVHPGTPFTLRCCLKR